MDLFGSVPQRLLELVKRSGILKSRRVINILRLIAVLKIAKAASAAAVGLILLEIIDRPTMEWLSYVSLWLSRRVETEIVKCIVGYFGEIGAHEIQALGWISLAYAAISTVEGIGLWLGHRWGKWLSVLITGSFIPLEMAEWIPHVSVIKTGVLSINIAVLIYLVSRIWVDRHRKYPAFVTDSPHRGGA